MMKSRIKRIALGFLLFSFVFTSGCSMTVSARGVEQKTLDGEIDKVHELVVRTYHTIHENPELGKKEFNTQKLITKRLKEMGYTEFVPSELAPTSVITILDTKKPGPVVALRAEMDARPLGEGVEEPLSHSPRSQIPGVMHNCGHDVHASILLGVAGILSKNTYALTGKIVFIFQPAEEIKGGADDIVNEGILKKLGIEKMFAQHVAGGTAVGTVSISPGYTLAGSNYFTVTVKGKQSHGALPSAGSDVPLAAAHLIQGLSYLPARRIDITNRPVVISVSRFFTPQGALNVIPPEATFKGTIRAFEDVTEGTGKGKTIQETIDNYLENASKAHDVTSEFSLRKGSPPTYNNPELFDEIIKKLGNAWPGVLDTTPFRGMFSEDFSYYTREVPCLYFGLGIRKGDHGNEGVHSSDFTIDEGALKTGLRLMTLVAQFATSGEAALK